MLFLLLLLLLFAAEVAAAAAAVVQLLFVKQCVAEFHLFGLVGGKGKRGSRRSMNTLYFFKLLTIFV